MNDDIAADGVMAADSIPAGGVPSDCATSDNVTPDGMKSGGIITGGVAPSDDAKYSRIPLDDETLARAVLTYCLDGADAMMLALLKGMGSAGMALQLLIDGNCETNSLVAHAAAKALDDAFITGLARWGRKITPRGMTSFHHSLTSWRQRLTTMPYREGPALSNWLTGNGMMWIIAPHSPYWPRQLNDLTVRTDWAPPLCLWGRGNPSALVSCPKPIGIVGSRGANDYGRQVAQEIARQASRNGHLVISGGAMGIDAAAHWTAVSVQTSMPEAAGATVAVFAGGLNHIGPKINQRLFDEIIVHGGALISELCPDTIPEARRFLLRNRIIAALSSTVVIVQARARSGALNTAGWANELNRELYAVPGDITMPNNTGCNRLIEEGKAIILCSCGDNGIFSHEPHMPAHTYLGKNAMGHDEAIDDATADINVADTGNIDTDGTPADSGQLRSGNADDVADAAAETTPTCASPSDDDIQHDIRNAILHAINICERRRIPATADTLCALLNDSQRTHPTVGSIMQGLGELEMNGDVTVVDGTQTYRLSSRPVRQSRV